MSSKGAAMGPGWKVEGTVTAAGDLEVRGSIEGEVRAGGELLVAKGGRIVGRAWARHIRVEGEVEGTLVAEEGIELLAGCTVNADLRARRLSMAQGASFQGAMDFEAGPAEAPSPQGKAAAPSAPARPPVAAEEGEGVEPAEGEEPAARPAQALPADAGAEGKGAASVEPASPDIPAAGEARRGASAPPPALPPSALRFGPLPLRIAE